MFDIFQAIFDAWLWCLLLLPRLLIWAGLTLLEETLEMLPPLDIVDPATLTSGFTGDLVWFLSVMEFPYGMAAVVSALVARFILRRIPLIG